MRTDEVLPLPYPHDTRLSGNYACTLGENAGTRFYWADPRCPGCLSWAIVKALENPHEYSGWVDRNGDMRAAPLWKAVQLELKEYGHDHLLVHYNRALYEKYPELKG